MKPSYQTFRRHSAGILGVVFLISGLLKLVDPVGTMLIVQEYFKFFHLAFLTDAAKAVGVTLALTECAVGIGLITGVCRKLSAIVAYAMLGVFTVITLLLWIFNPPMDCGCFGQAVHLSHAQSFWKNVALIVLAVVAFTPFKEFGTPRLHKNVAAGVAFAALILAAVYCNSHLPAVDFTPFNWGAQLFASLDENADEADFRRAPILSFFDAEGNYIIKGKSFKNSNFFEYFKSYNTTSSEEYGNVINEIASNHAVMVGGADLTERSRIQKRFYISFRKFIYAATKRSRRYFKRTYR